MDQETLTIGQEKLRDQPHTESCQGLVEVRGKACKIRMPIDAGRKAQPEGEELCSDGERDNQENDVRILDVVVWHEEKPSCNRIEKFPGFELWPKPEGSEHSPSLPLVRTFRQTVQVVD
jgi:hypothetical protein